MESQHGSRACHLRYYAFSAIVICSVVFYFMLNVDVGVLQQKFGLGWRTISSTNISRPAFDKSKYDRNLHVSQLRVNLDYAAIFPDSTGRNKVDSSHRTVNRANDTHEDIDQLFYYRLLRRHGMESKVFHHFKSPYIVDPAIYDDDVISPKAPGKRQTKIISCFNCPPWFIDQSKNQHNRDFKRCPYSECQFFNRYRKASRSDVVMFFATPRKVEMPPRPLGQIWAYCSWESPVHYGYPAPYNKWRNVFNWTITYQLNSDLFFPNNRLVWRDSKTMLPDAEYERIAKRKTKTAAWFVSNCGTISKRQDYVKEMEKYIDIDIYGACGTIGRCDEETCLKKLNDTYKFYLAFENSFCRDYVTEKLFRNFDQRLHVIPVVRGGLEYEKYIPPMTFINAGNFTSAKELALYLRDLGNDVSRYSQMLKEKDRLKTLNYKHDWCETCEKLHTGDKPKTINDIKEYLSENACWH